jgi:tRNA threonylcarbamoyladenosine biosynthesis protein TsaB
MTAPLLVIDASTYRGTAAIVAGDRVLAETETQMRGADQERLMPAVARLLSDIAISPRALGGIVCGEGPGSFTSLRIAASIAKGLLTATGQPLFAVSSLLLVVAGAAPALGAGRYLVLLDAMRGEWFAARVTVGGDGVPALEDDFGVLDADGIHKVMTRERRVTVGPGQTIDAAPHARGVAGLGGQLSALRPVALSTWEPSYGRLAEAQARWERSHGRPLVV